MRVGRGAALDAVQLPQDLLGLGGDGPGVRGRLLLDDVAREGTGVDVVGLRIVEEHFGVNIHHAALVFL